MTDLASLLFQQDKLAALGVADPRLAPRWAVNAPSSGWDDATLAVSFSGQVYAPFAGFAQTQALVTLVDESGSAMTSGGTVVEMHPAAYLALVRLYPKLQATQTSLQRPVPRYLYVFAGSGAPTGAVRACDSLGTDQTYTFHDARGLIVDAGAVAAAFLALLELLPGLNADPSIDPTTGLGAMLSGTSTTILVLASTPHGGPWSDPGDGKGVTVTPGASGTPQRLGGDVVSLTSRAGASVHVEDAASLVRAALYPSGLLGTSDVALPDLAAGVTLNRDFLRVTACDLATFLPGQRDADVVDAPTAAEPAPTVRDGVAVTTLVDGVEFLHEVASVVAAAGPGGEALLVSPDIVATRLPAGAAIADRHWPAHPAFPTVPFEAWSAGGTGPLRANGGVTATWASDGSVDVMVSIAAGALPAGAFVRVFPRRMVFPDTLASGPSIVRGDGASTIAPAGEACVLRLTDPLGLGTSPRPAGTTNLNLDLLVVPRPPSGAPRPRLLGGFSLPIGAETAVTPTAPTDFDEVDEFTSVAATGRGICHAGVLGFARPSDPFAALSWPSSGSAVDIATFLVSLAESLGDEGSPSAPRDAPRMPTMARRETLAAARSGGPTQTWRSVLGGGWLTPRSRTSSPRQGNPGWPAEGEYDVTGVAVDGQLAYDVARAALRRARGLEPRMTALNDDTTWGEPAPGSGRWAGAALQSVAAYCETPDLALVPDPSILPDGTSGSSWTSILSQLPASVQSALGGVVPVQPRAFAEIRREAFAAKYGRRDAQVALRRAIGDAREIVYIEAARFGATSHDDGAPQGSDGSADDAAQWDIVSALADRLAAVPTLRVVVCVPKLPDYPPAYESFALFEYQARQAALSSLTEAGSDRVTVLHPIGFPGRPLRTGTTVVCVDDVWLLVGTSSPTRRGLTFDGSTDVVLLDRQLDEGYSAGIRQLRRALMGRMVGASAPSAGATSTATWVKLARPAPAALAVSELVGTEGGAGLAEPLYTPTPTAGHGQPAAPSLADPDGRNVSSFIVAGADLLSGLEMLPAT